MIHPIGHFTKPINVTPLRLWTMLCCLHNAPQTSAERTQYKIALSGFSKNNSLQYR